MTYRLQCASLVAVGRLSYLSDSIQPATRISFAEVVPFNPSDTIEEPQARASDHMALRLLGRSDGFPPASDFVIGTRIFLIDLRVSVPEVIPVLATYADPSLAEQLGHISFVARFIGYGARPMPSLGNAPLRQRVSEAIGSSEIKVLQRMSAGVRAGLAGCIANLTQQSNLYGTQLDAFCQALQYARCTARKGRPGRARAIPALF